MIGLSGPLPGGNSSIHVFDMKERKDSVLVAGANNFALSFDGKKLLYLAPKGGPRKLEVRTIPSASWTPLLQARLRTRRVMVNSI